MAEQEEEVAPQKEEEKQLTIDDAPPPPGGPPMQKAIGQPMYGVRSKGEFAGLYNQGATCYLNSLLQCLFMTPEFKDVLMKWNYNPEVHGKAEFCIPYQLQLLFARLANSDQSATSTKDLTHSFHWDSQVFQQHDIQELMLVLFDAMTKIFGKSEDGDPDFFDRMFRGSISDYIAGQTFPLRNRVNKFTDLSIPIEGKSSLEEGIEGYLEPEFIKGEYYDEECERKVDIIKGEAFESLPPILFVQMGRFAFSMKTFRREKLKHLVTFPDILDMSKHVSGTKLYELYGAVIHSGGALGGHYYSHIKDVATGEWYSFNDAGVRKITKKDRELTFGGPADRDKNRFGRSGTAYCLLYRQQGLSLPPPVELNESVRAVIQAEDEKRRKEFEEWDRKMRQVSVNCTYQGKEFTFTEVDSQEVSMGDLLRMCREKFGVDASVSEECVRLRKFDSVHGFSGEPFTEMSDPLRVAGLKIKFNNVVLETRAENEEFPVWDPDAILVRVMNVTDDIVKDVAEEASRVLQKATKFTDNMFNVELKTHSMGSELQTKVEEWMEANSLTDQANAAVLLKVGKIGMQLIAIDKTLDDQFVRMGSTVYLQHLPKGFEQIPLQIEYVESKMKVDISFNNPNEPGVKYDYTISINKMLPLLELKKRISELLELPMNKFRLRKSSNSGVLRDLKKAIDDHNVRSLIYVELGTPIGMDEYLVKFSLYDSTGFLTDPNAHKKKKKSSRRKWIEKFVTLAVNKNEKPPEFSQLVVDAITQKYPPLDTGKAEDGEEKSKLLNMYNIRHVRFRKKRGKTTDGILFDDQKLMQQCRADMNDGLQLAVERVDEHFSFSSKDMIIKCKRYQGNTGGSGKLFGMFELFCRRDSTIGEVKKQIVDRFKNHETVKIAYETLSFARGRKMLKAPECHKLKWVPAEFDGEKVSAREPLQVRNGDYLILQDISQSMSDEQVAKNTAAREEKRNNAKRGRGNFLDAIKSKWQPAASSGNYGRNREAALKIWTEDEYAEEQLRKQQLIEERENEMEKQRQEAASKPKAKAATEAESPPPPKNADLLAELKGGPPNTLAPAEPMEEEVESKAPVLE